MAFYRTLQSRGATSEGITKNEQLIKIKVNLEDFACGNKLSAESDGFNILDFDKCKVNRLRGIDKKYRNFQLKIVDVKNDEESDVFSCYSFKYEHIIIANGDCLRIISVVTKDSKKYFLCRASEEVGISREERLPEIEPKDVEHIFKIETIETI